MPQTVVHQYQVIGPYSEFVGLIVPGGWEEFFRFIGEPYGGPLFPINDNRNIFEVLIPKLQAATLEHDVVPLPHHPSFDPQPWPKDGDSELPGATEPYFIRNGAGNQYLAAGGILCRPLITKAESSDKFSIASLEGTSHYNSGLQRRHQRSNLKVFIIAFKLQMGPSNLLSKDPHRVQLVSAGAKPSTYRLGRRSSSDLRANTQRHMSFAMEAG